LPEKPKSLERAIRLEKPMEEERASIGKKSNLLERVLYHKESKNEERANDLEKSTTVERANIPKKPNIMERAILGEKTIG